MGEREVNRVAILDRDGTIIDVVRDEETGTVVTAFHPDQLAFLPGAIDGLRALASAGFTLAIATNQPGPAKGQISASAVSRTNQALVRKLAADGVTIAAIEVCMHHPDGGPGGDPALIRPCSCRKPGPGMLQALLRQLDGDPAQSWMIGDAAVDVEAGRAAGMNCALVFASGRCELCPLRHPTSRSPGMPAAQGATLAQVADAILHRA
jgi:D-glycero-D-manno-heptose 1,7-bisphosphate phosphatase